MMEFDTKAIEELEEKMTAYDRLGEAPSKCIGLAQECIKAAGLEPIQDGYVNAASVCLLWVRNPFYQIQYCLLFLWNQFYQTGNLPLTILKNYFSLGFYIG